MSAVLPCRVDLMYNKALSLKKLGRIDAAASIVAEAVAALDDKTATRKVMGLERIRDQMCAAKPSGYMRHTWLGSPITPLLRGGCA
jgi:hypothetical protein